MNRDDLDTTYLHGVRSKYANYPNKMGGPDWPYAPETFRPTITPATLSINAVRQGNAQIAGWAGLIIGILLLAVRRATMLAVSSRKRVSKTQCRFR